MALYRKYRPQTLDELIGQTAVKNSLKSAISSGKLAHAYLFSGPRGLGKTSAARILAKIVNCELANSESRNLDDSKILNRANEQTSKREMILPCNACPTCLSITDGSNLDVIEMDAASNRGIEDIRSLRENIKLSPTSARKKVYIIDEVHMLTGEAFNALLKTLEEPPSHVIFILATTETQKVPQTILSRVQRLEFKLASMEELVEVLGKVATGEGIEIGKEALSSLAKKARGSFRDGVKLLDQLSGAGKIDEKFIDERLGAGSWEGVMDILKNISEKDSSLALLSLTKQLEVGTNIKELNITILDVLRQCLLIKNGLGDQLVKGEVEGEDYKTLSDLATKFSMEKLISTINNFQKSLEESRFVSIPSLPLEVAVVESGMEEKIQNLKFKVQNEEEQPHPVPVILGTLSERSESKGTPESINKDPGQVLRSRGPQDRGASMTNTKRDDDNISEAASSESSADMPKLQEKWIYVLETVRQYNFSLEALLRTAKILECDEENVVLEVPYSFHQRIIEAPKSRDVLDSLFSDILGRTVRVSAVLGKRQVSKEELSNVEVAADDEIVRMAAEIFSSDSVS